MRILAGSAIAAALALVALSVAHGQQSTERSVNWERARQAISKYRPVIDNSGLVEVDAQISVLGGRRGSRRALPGPQRRHRRRAQARHRRAERDRRRPRSDHRRAARQRLPAARVGRLLRGQGQRRGEELRRRARRPGALPEGLPRPLEEIRDARRGRRRRAHAAGRGGQLPGDVHAGSVHLPAASGRASPRHRRRRRRAQGVPRVPEAAAERPRGPLAREPVDDDPRPRRKHAAGGPANPGERVRVAREDAAVLRRGAGRQARTLRDGRRHRRRRLRRRRPARRGVLERGLLRAARLLPQSRRRHVRGPQRGGRPDDRDSAA